MVRLLLEIERHSSVKQEGELACLTEVQGALDWLPTRFLALLFAVVGDFSNTFHYWWRHGRLLTNMAPD